MVLPGYPPEDLLLRASFVEENLAAWREVAGSARGVTVVAGFVDRDGKGRVYNAAGVAADGQVLGVYRKMHLPNYGVFDEMRYFRRGAAPGISRWATPASGSRSARISGCAGGRWRGRQRGGLA